MNSFLSLFILAILFNFVTNFVSIRADSIIDGMKVVLDGVSSFIDDLSFGVKQAKEGLNTVEEIVNYAQGKECEYKCPSGGKLRKNAYHKPVPEGCGSYGIQLVLKMPLLKDAEKCCNKHDICYSTCMNDKNSCDAEFEKCLYKKCEKQAKHLDEDVRKCSGVSKLFHMGVQALGCSAFKSAQSEACICSNRNEL